MPDLFMLHLCQLFAQRPTLRSLGITQAHLDQQYQDVLDHYSEQLIRFFSKPNPRKGSRWAHLAQMLAGRLHLARLALDDTPVRAMVGAVLSYPDSGQRDSQLGEHSPQVYRMTRHDCLGLAIRLTGVPLVVFTLARGFETLDDASTSLADAEYLEHDVFEEWALGALDAVLQRVAQIDPARFSRLDALELQLALASRPSDFIEYQANQDPLRHELEQQLPAWLKNAVSEGCVAYSRWLEALALFHGTSESKTAQEQFERQLALHLRRLTLECWLKGESNVTSEGYRVMRAALKTQASDRRLHGVVVAFRPLLDGSGYLVGPSWGSQGTWLLVRPGTAQVIEQVGTQQEVGAPLSDPLAALYHAGRECWLPLFEEPLETLARLKQVGGNLQGECASAPTMRCNVSLLRNLALLLVCPGAVQPAGPVVNMARLKRLDGAWAGAHEDLSVAQNQRMEALRLPSPKTLGSLITDGVHKGLQWLGGVLVYNKDENHYNVFSNNQIYFNVPVVEHQLVDQPEQPTLYGPHIAPDANSHWQPQRAPRLRRDLDRQSPAQVSARLSELLRAATWRSQVPGTLPVEVEEGLERSARAFDDAVRTLQRTGDNAAQVRQLSDGARELRAYGRRLRIDMVRHTPRPTVGDVEYLLRQQVIRICRVDGRMAETIDGQMDYLQEYEVQDLTDGNKPLWYAHFHYATLQTADDHPTKAHLKTVAQRKLGRLFEQSERTAGRNTQVYRGPITNVAGRQLFLGVRCPT
jgi:hypothetical protein